MTTEQENKVIRNALAREQACNRDAKQFEELSAVARRYDDEEARKAIWRLRDAALAAAANIREQMKALPGYAESEFGGKALDSLLASIPEFPTEE